MPEAVEMRERKPRGQGRARVQGHIPSADSVLRAIMKSRDEERQKLVDQCCESLDATPTPSVQSLGQTHPHVVTLNPAGLNDCSKTSFSAKEMERLEVQFDEQRLLIIVTDHSPEAIMRHERSSIDTNTVNFSQRSRRRCSSINSRSAVKSHSQNDSQDSIEIRTERKSKSRRRSQSSRRKSGGKKSCEKEKKRESKVSFDTLVDEGDTPMRGSLDEMDRKKSNRRKFHKKRFAKKTGKKIWKGLRISCRFLWSGLALYAKPFGNMEFNFVKAWEERQETERKRRQYFSYNEPRHYAA